VIVKQIRNQSGFGWDDEKQIPTASDEVWDAYIEKHKEAAAFRKNSLPQFDLLDKIYTGVIASGQFATPSGQISGFLESDEGEETSDLIFPFSNPMLQNNNYSTSSNEHVLQLNKRKRPRQNETVASALKALAESQNYVSDKKSTSHSKLAINAFREHYAYNYDAEMKLKSLI
jgi:hypothetical protein